MRLDLANAGTFFLTSDQFHLRDDYEGPQPLAWLLRDLVGWWRSCRKVKLLPSARARGSCSATTPMY